uniref:Uncharacterized protein n=1 Tax=Pseudictyota dubia TaxID=2749911 RepID=A0A7R9WHU0_9STRA
MGTTMGDDEERWLTGDRGSGNWYVYTKDRDAEWDIRTHYQWQIITALGNDGAEKRFWNQAWYSIELVKDAYKESAADVKYEDDVGFDNTFYVYDNQIDTAVVATKGEAVFVAFRGTKDLVDKILQGAFATDVLQVAQDGNYPIGNTNCMLHYGLAFWADDLLDTTSRNNWYDSKTMKDRVVDLMTACGSSCKLVISGHSAGAPQALYMAGMDTFRGYDPIVMNFGGLPGVHKDHTTHCEAIIDPVNIFNFVYQDNTAIDPVPFFDETCQAETTICANFVHSDRFRNIGKYIYMERNSNDVQETISTGSIKQKSDISHAVATHSSSHYLDKVKSLRDHHIMGSGVRTHGYEYGTPCGYDSLDFLCAGTCKKDNSDYKCKT